MRGQEIAYDEDGNIKTGTLMDFFMPPAAIISTAVLPPDHRRKRRQLGQAASARVAP